MKIPMAIMAVMSRFLPDKNLVYMLGSRVSSSSSMAVSDEAGVRLFDLGDSGSGDIS